MNDDIKRIDIKEFRQLGFIQEINRLVLHPCGLALEVIIDEDDGSEKLGGVWDYRDDPEGMAFADYMIAPSKARLVAGLIESKREVREIELGYHIQPISKGPDHGNGT